MTINASTPAIHEPADDLIDALIDLVEVRIDDEPDLAHYVAETLAEGLGFEVTLTRPKPSPGLLAALRRHRERVCE